MRYIDSYRRSSDQTLGEWLVEAVAEQTTKVRWQSGFFNSEPLGLIETQLRRVSTAGEGVLALVGSNDGVTTQQSLADLVAVLDLPQPESRVGVVNLDTAIYHPKTFHIERSDGSQAAYVGSANLTGSGASLHVEAGVILDTRDGDAEALLTTIGGAVDAWFVDAPQWLHLVNTQADIPPLVASGVVGVSRPVGAPRVSTTTSTRRASGSAGLGRIISIPDLSLGPEPIPPSFAAVVGVALGDYPPDVLFAPGSAGPTSRERALSGAALGSGAASLVIRLTRPSTKHFEGRAGTSDVSLPNEVLGTLLFGIAGTRRLPRATFGFRARYLSGSQDLRSRAATTSVTYYGVGPAAGTTHRNLRLVVPSVVRGLGEDIRRAGLPVPRVGDVALVTWPTPADPVMRMTFMDPSTRTYRAAADALDEAIATHSAIGQDSSAWAEDSLVPTW